MSGAGYRRFFAFLCATAFLVDPGNAAPQSAGNVYVQAETSAGSGIHQVVFEAEAFGASTTSASHAWNLITTPTGFVGAGALQAGPNTGANNNTGYVQSSPRLDYYVQFTQTGTHYVWIRGYGIDGSGDSVHAGLDGVGPTTCDRINSFGASYQWRTVTMDGGSATLNVPTVGVHTFHLWMREDGFIVDRVVISTAATPPTLGNGSTVAGPAVSAQAAAPPPSFDPTPTSPLADATYGIWTSRQFTATGLGPPTFSVTGGALPGGMSLSSSGYYSGTPNAVGSFNFTVTATNSTGSDSRVFDHTVIAGAGGPPQIVTPPAGALPTETEGIPTASTWFTATGLAPITYAVTSGALPPGMTLNSVTGEYDGIPTQAGSYSFTVTATGAAAPPDSEAYTQTIAAPGGQAPTITDPASPLPDATEGSYYSITFTASGNPTSWSVTGTTPAGMVFNTGTGDYSGTPSAGSAGIYNFDVTATNAEGSHTVSYQHTVIAPGGGAPTITGPATPLSAGTENVAYNTTFSATGAAPIGWSVILGSLPPGMSLNTGTGAYTGTPTTAGVYSFTIQALNGSGSDSRAYSHTINAATGSAPTITAPTSLSNGTTTVAYSSGFAATGTVPITWSLALGTLPAGMSINPTTGAYTGTPTVAGSFTFTVRAQNGYGQNTRQYTHTIVTQTAGPPVITGPNPPLADGTVGVPYSVAATATGDPTITWSVVPGGPLPPGMSLDANTGVYSGTPSSAGSFTFTFRALNASGNDTQSYTHTINPVGGTPPTITGPASPLSPATQNVPFTATVTATGSSPLTWSLTAGALPAGMGLNTSDGTYAGTPTAVGSFSFTITVTNALGSDSRAYAHDVLAPVAGAPSNLQPAALPDLTVNVPFSTTFTAQGAATITWSITAGAVPPGMALDPNTGQYVGTPTTAGAYSFTVTATNPSGATSVALSQLVALVLAGGGSSGGSGGGGCGGATAPAPPLHALLAAAGVLAFLIIAGRR
jgi:hypothetical protein